MLNPFIDLLSSIIYLYSLAVIIWAVLSILISFRIVNTAHPVVYKLDYYLSRLIEPVLRPIRKIIPKLGDLDISPIVLLLLLRFLNSALYNWFYTI